MVDTGKQQHAGNPYVDKLVQYKKWKIGYLKASLMFSSNF